MADKKISELPVKTTLAGTEELVLNDSGVSKKVTQANLGVSTLTQTALDLKANIANFTSTGIDDNATSTAITIGADEKTTFWNSPTIRGDATVGSAAITINPSNNTGLNFVVRQDSAGGGIVEVGTTSNHHTSIISGGNAIMNAAPTGGASFTGSVSVVGTVNGLDIDTTGGKIIFSEGGDPWLSHGGTSQAGLELHNDYDTNLNLRLVITRGGGGTNTVQVYWNIAYGTTAGVLGAWDQSGNWAAPGTVIAGSNVWTIYGFIYEGA